MGGYGREKEGGEDTVGKRREGREFILCL